MTGSTSVTTQRRRVLISAFACSPEIGSEPGVGWRWALELSQRHDVTVVTHEHFRAHIEPRLAIEPRPGLTVSYHSVPGLRLPMHIELNSRACYWLWQFSVRAHVRRLLRERSFDLIHHLTWGTYRFPSFLGRLGVPFAIGPIGGGEGAPWRLYRSWPLRERAFYALRQTSIAFSRWDPFVLWTMSGADCVLTKTRQTREALPWFARRVATEASEIGVTRVTPRASAHSNADTPRRALHLLYAGRLLGGKGVPYVLSMMKHVAERGIAARLSLAGDGRLQRWAEQRIVELNLQECVRLLGKVPRDRMDALYDDHDMLVMPSWHDSSGNVVTEAMARGLPIMCLDRGGPVEAVTAQCAVIVPTVDAGEDDVARAMADEVGRLVDDRERLARMSQAATLRASELTWSTQVKRAYDIIEARLGWAGTREGVA